MINDKRIAQEAERLFSLPFPPSTELARRNYLDGYKQVLRDRIESAEHLKAIIDYVMNTAKRCPPPAEVLEAAMEVRPPAKVKAPLGCAECQGSGYVHFTKVVRIAGMDPYEADFSKPCDCALGQFIQPEYDKRRNVTSGRAKDLG